MKESKGPYAVVKVSKEESKRLKDVENLITIDEMRTKSPGKDPHSLKSKE